MWVQWKEVDYVYDIICFERGEQRWVRDNFPWWISPRDCQNYNHLIVPWLYGAVSNDEVRAFAALSHERPKNWIAK
jgi:hypothetical protein